MTQDAIIRMAREAGSLVFQSNFCDSSFDFNLEQLEHFFNLAFEAGAAHAKAEEREACAKVADNELMNTNMLTSHPPKSSAAWNIAAAIRSRGEA